MLQTLEGVLVALLMAMAPADRPGDGSTTLAELRIEALAACEPYSNETARRNCIARLERALEPADEEAAVFTEQVAWIAPSDPGMPDRAALLLRSR
jgi:heterodisulfide reductase subunit A-like polyferredoxin